MTPVISLGRSQNPPDEYKLTNIFNGYLNVGMILKQKTLSGTIFLNKK